MFKPFLQQPSINGASKPQQHPLGHAEVTVFTDGACEDNPGRGGWGTVIRKDGHDVQASGGFRRTTNNRMELMATIAGLEHIGQEPRTVSIVSDSRYVTDSISKGWLKKWILFKFMKPDGSPRENADLWRRLNDAMSPHAVKTVWIKGHAGHTENEICDQLAVAARLRSDLPVDDGYERAQALKNSLRQHEMDLS